MSGIYEGVGRWEGVGWMMEKGGQLEVVMPSIRTQAAMLYLQ